MSTYGAKLRAKLDPQHPCNQSFGTKKFPGGMDDDEAELKLTGGFDTRKSNICPRCFTTRSQNGSCGC